MRRPARRLGILDHGCLDGVLGLIFGVAGVLQTYLERILDIGYSTAHMTMMFWFKAVLFFGVISLCGVLQTVYHLLTLKRASE